MAIPVRAIRRLAAEELERELGRWSRPRRLRGRNALSGVSDYIRGEGVDPWAEPLAAMTIAGGGIAGASYAQHRRNNPPDLELRRQELAALRREQDIRSSAVTVGVTGDERFIRHIPRTSDPPYYREAWLARYAQRRRIAENLRRLREQVFGADPSDITGIPGRDHPEMGLVYEDPYRGYPGEYFADFEGDDQ